MRGSPPPVGDREPPHGFDGNGDLSACFVSPRMIEVSEITVRADRIARGQAGLPRRRSHGQRFSAAPRLRKRLHNRKRRLQLIRDKGASSVLS